MKKTPLITLVLLLWCALGRTQSPADWWYFGQKAGVHFTSSGPVADLDGELQTSEGCASMSDINGNLLFYTDGTTVWNAQHQVMPDGTGLLGNSSSTQSAIIVPRPLNTEQYYIITLSTTTSIGLNYSLVDMTLESGLGNVVVSEKNQSIRTNIREKGVVITRPNSPNYWLVSQPIWSDTVCAFSITSSGVNTTPVISVTGDSASNLSGYLKANIAGDLIVSGHEQGYIQLMEFDLTTGQVNDVISWTLIPQAGYGAEFSPSGELLYMAPRSSSGRLYQYNVTVYDSAAIVSSSTLIADSMGTGALQLGPDQKIYMATTGGANNGYISCINDPDVPGLGCNFVDTAVYLEGRICTQGLPPFIAAFFQAGIVSQNYCFNDSTLFSLEDTTGIDSLFWNFGDPSSGSDNASEQFFPSHVFTDTGTFEITLVAYIDTIFDTARQVIEILPRQTVDLGNDTTICIGDTIHKSVKQPHATFLWGGGSANDSAFLYSDSLVMVTVFGACDTVSDTVMLSVVDTLVLDLGPDTLVCGNSNYSLDPGTTGATTLAWSTGDSSLVLVPTVSGVYILTATNACGSVVDSVDVELKPIPAGAFLPSDTLNCFDDPIVLERPDQDSITYIWSDSTSKKNYTVDTTETVWLAAFNECGFSVDTIDIIFNGEILSELGEDTNICEGDSILLIATHPGASYVWNTGDTTDTAWTDQVESFNYVVTVTYKACQTIESKRVDMDDFFCEPIDCKLEYPNVFSPNGDGINDIFRAWSDCDIYSYSLYVYNRWGQLVHFDAHASFGWDGSSNGQPAPPGVYYFVIDFLDNVVVDEDRQTYQGSFTLVR